MILAIDPGIRQCGVTAAAPNGRAFDAWLSRSRERAKVRAGEHVPAATGPLAWRGMVSALYVDLRERGYLERVRVLVVEWPEVYEKQKTDRRGHKKNPNDLLDLAAVLGGLVCAMPRLERYEQFIPRVWKKSFPKEDYQDAIIHALDPDERVLLEKVTPSLRHNVVESLGLARFAATVLAGAPMSVPAFQSAAIAAGPRRAAPAPKASSAGAKPEPARAPAYRTALPAGTGSAPSYGSKHFPAGRAPTRAKDWAAKATPASYGPKR